MKLVSGITKTLVISMLVASTTVSTFAATTANKSTLTLEQAISRAITSCDKKTVYSSYLNAYEEITKYNQDYFSPDFRTKKLQEKTYEFKMNHINDKITYDTTDAYLSVINLNKQIEMVKSNVSIGEKKLNQVAIKKEKGMASELEYKEAENQLKELNTQLITLQKSLDNEVMEFKNLTNMVITDYQLDTEFELAPAAIEGAPQSYFDKKLEEYYSLEKERIEISELGLKGVFDVSIGDYMLQQAGLVENQYTLDDLKKSTSTTLMSYYNNLDGYKADVETYKIKIKSAKEKLKAYEIRYNNGYISKLDYEQALLEEQQLEASMFTKIQTYLTTKMMVEEPNALVMK